LKRSISKKRSFISMLVLIIYTLVVLFLATSTTLVAGQALTTYKLCVAGTWICLILYTFTKLAIFLFLVERIHIVRAPFVQRRHDKIYLACLSIVLFGFCPATINGYIGPVINMGPEGRRCYFGIRGSASIPILGMNIFVDLVLTGVFLYLLRQGHGLPGFSNKLWNKKGRGASRACGDASETPMQRNIRTLLWKSIIGGLLIELPMMGNMIQFMVTKGHELGTVCLGLCVVEGKSAIFFWNTSQHLLTTNSCLGYVYYPLVGVWHVRSGEKPAAIIGDLESTATHPAAIQRTVIGKRWLEESGQCSVYRTSKGGADQGNGVVERHAAPARVKFSICTAKALGTHENAITVTYYKSKEPRLTSHNQMLFARDYCSRLF
jgi:hypothetical protein